MSQGGWREYKPGLIEGVLRRRKYLKTPWGRHLHPEQWGEHKMLNKLIQGSAADLMKQAIIRAASWQSGAPESRLVLTVHDELVFDGPVEELPLLNAAIPLLMDDAAISEVVPLGVDHEISLTNLAEKIGYDEWKEQSGRSGSAPSRAGAAAR